MRMRMRMRTRTRTRTRMRMRHLPHLMTCQPHTPSPLLGLVTMAVSLRAVMTVAVTAAIALVGRGGGGGVMAVAACN